MEWCFHGEISKVPLQSLVFFFMPLFMSLFFTGTSYLFVLPVDPLKCILRVFLLSHWVLWSSFIRLVWVGTDNWIGTSCSLERKTPFLLPNLSFYIMLLPFKDTNFQCPASQHDAYQYVFVSDFILLFNGLCPGLMWDMNLQHFALVFINTDRCTNTYEVALEKMFCWYSLVEL